MIIFLKDFVKKIGYGFGFGFGMGVAYLLINNITYKLNINDKRDGLNSNK